MNSINTIMRRLALSILLALPLFAETGEALSSSGTLDTQLPTVVVLYPNGAEILTIGQEVEISWTAADFSFGALPIKIYFSYNGITYPDMTDFEENDGIFSWTIPNEPTDSAKIFILVVDEFGNLDIDYTDDLFSITGGLDVGYVATWGSDETGDGTEENPFATIQHGIDVADEGQIVMVAPGTYSGGGNIDLNFDGKAITVMSEAGAEQTIIDCGGADRGFTFDSGEVLTSVLDGFTIINGNRSQGGGIYCYYSSPTIKNCIIANCITNDGGGIYLTYSNPTIINLTISGNSAEFGGGMDIQYSDPILINLTICNNTAQDGGGMEFWHSNATIINTIIWDNIPPSFYQVNSLPIINYSNIEGGWEDEGNIDTNPFFTDSGNGDFSLLENSPCIDAGIAYFEWQGEVIVDLNPEDYNGAAPDMGAFESDFGCSNLGDLNGDGGWNVLDIVTLVSCILAENCGDGALNWDGLDCGDGNCYGCAGDINDDGGWNILDVVTLVSCVLADNCS